MNQALAELVRRKQSQGVAGPIDWDERRNRYVAAVSDLYTQVESFLAEPLAQNAVKISRRPKQLSEHVLGTYTVDDLLLQIGGEQVRFSPHGRNVAGAAGRIDVMGERADAMLLLQFDGQWGFLERREPELRLAPFNEQTFAEVLQLVMRA